MTASSRPFALLHITTGSLGLVASLALLLETLALAADPAATAWCDVNSFIGCSTSISSAQGSLLGVPNPVLGIVFWSGTLTVGLAMLSGFRPARWFTIGFLLAVTGAFALVVWFVVQSIFVIGVLCPWCMLTWAVTIPLFLALLVRALATAELPSPRSVRRAAVGAMEWIPLLTVLCYVVVAAAAHVRLDLLGQLARS